MDKPVEMGNENPLTAKGNHGFVKVKQCSGLRQPDQFQIERV
jgi:hypothetical protein